MEGMDVVELRESILDLLMARFSGRILDPDIVSEANQLVLDRFSQLDRAGALPITFGEGAVLTGYEVVIDHERSSLGLTPRTEFFPSHRYSPVGTTSENRIALGISGRFDLWVIKEEPRPPTIVARYGDGADDYLSANPALLGLNLIRQIGEPFPEALTRLIRLGLLVDDGTLDAFDPDASWPRSPTKTPAQPQPHGGPTRRLRKFSWWRRRR
jgi:hypothetical protein